MELLLENGKYVPAPSGGLKTVSGAAETAQRAAMKLKARRGGFAPMPGYGSRLHTLLGDVKPALRESAARAFIAEALSDEPTLRVGSVTVAVADGEAVIRAELTCTESGTFSVRIDEGGTTI